MLDVLWTPTDPSLVEAMLDMAELRPEDVLMDLGSGDGRIVIAAAKRGIRAIGIELDLEHIEESSAAARAAGVHCEFRLQNYALTDLNEATVITCFLDRAPHRNLTKRLANLKPGTRILSNTFHLWEHDAERTVSGVREFHTARMWMVA